MTVVVSNTSPIAALSFIQQLDLLHQLYDQVLIPDAVWQEVAVGGAHYDSQTGKPGLDFERKRYGSEGKKAL